MDETYFFFLIAIVVIILLIVLIYSWRLSPWLAIRRMLIACLMIILTIGLFWWILRPVGRAIFLIFIFLAALLYIAWAWELTTRPFTYEGQTYEGQTYDDDYSPRVGIAILMGLLVLAYVAAIICQVYELRNLTSP